MAKYYVNLIAEPDGYHLVHQEDCEHRPDLEDVLLLGLYGRAGVAIKHARKVFPQTRACKRCIKEAQVSKVLERVAEAANQNFL